MRNIKQLRFGLACVILWALAGPGAAEAPQGHFVIIAETVEDVATKLTWQRSASKKKYSSSEAAAYCAALVLRGSGWRLPTIKELHTLVDETRTNPAIDAQAFPETPAGYFWSASRVANFAMYGWTVNFADGSDLWYPVENLQHVRCVR